MTDIWNAAIYSEFLEARTKVAKDLLFGISERHFKYEVQHPCLLATY